MTGPDAFVALDSEDLAVISAHAGQRPLVSLTIPTGRRATSSPRSPPTASYWEEAARKRKGFERRRRCPAQAVLSVRSIGIDRARRDDVLSPRRSLRRFEQKGE